MISTAVEERRTKQQEHASLPSLKVPKEDYRRTLENGDDQLKRFTAGHQGNFLSLVICSVELLSNYW